MGAGEAAVCSVPRGRRRGTSARYHWRAASGSVGREREPPPRVGAARRGRPGRRREPRPRCRPRPRRPGAGKGSPRAGPSRAQGRRAARRARPTANEPRPRPAPGARDKRHEREAPHAGRTEPRGPRQNPWTGATRAPYPPGLAARGAGAPCRVRRLSSRAPRPAAFRRPLDLEDAPGATAGLVPADRCARRRGEPDHGATATLTGPRARPAERRRSPGRAASPWRARDRPPATRVQTPPTAGPITAPLTFVALRVSASAFVKRQARRRRVSGRARRPP